MSPATTVIRDQYGDRPESRPMPYPIADLLLSLSREIVVDWQLPGDHERKN